MHLAATLNSPETTKMLVIGGAGFMVVALGGWFVVSYRRNQREHGELTRTESSLNRGHAVAILLSLVISMSLAVGAVLSPTVRAVLSIVGENSRWIPIVFVPLVLAYLRWLTRRIALIVAERAERAIRAGFEN